MTDETISNRPRIPPPRSAPPLDLVPPPRFARTGSLLIAIPIALAAWLVISTIAWPHARDARLNDVLAAVLAMGFAAVSLYKPPLRWIVAGLGIWIGASALVIEHVVEVTRWHDLAIGIAIAVSAIAARPRS